MCINIDAYEKRIMIKKKKEGKRKCYMREKIRDKALHVLKNGGGNEMDEIFNQNERNTGKRDENIRSEVDKKERDEREKGYNTINLYPMGIVTANETESEMYM